MPDDKKQIDWSGFKPLEIEDKKPREEESSSFGQIFGEVWDKTKAIGNLMNPVNSIAIKILEDEQAGKKNFIMEEVIPVLTAPGQAFDEGLAWLGIDVPWNPSAKYKEVETVGALGKVKIEKEYNPLAAAPKFIESMLHLGATPFSALDQTLRHHGLETEANIIAFPGEKFAEGYVAGKSLIQEGLNQIPGYSLEKEREALRLVLMTKGVSSEIAFDDGKLDEAINNFDSVGQIAASIIPYAGLGKAAGLGKQIGKKFKKPLPVKTDPYVEPLKPKELDIPRGEGSFGGREAGGAVRNLTREKQVRLGEIKLGRDEALNERIYLQDKVKLNAQEIRDLKGAKGKEAVAKRKAIIKENAESFKRIKELDEIAEYRSKEIEAFESKPTVGLLKEHNPPPLKDMSGTNAPSNINFAVATESGAKTTTGISPERVLPVKRAFKESLIDKSFQDRTLDSGMLRDILQTAKEQGVEAEILKVLRTEVIKRKMAKEFDIAYQEATKKPAPEKTEVKPAESKQIEAKVETEKFTGYRGISSKNEGQLGQGTFYFKENVATKDPARAKKIELEFSNPLKEYEKKESTSGVPAEDLVRDKLPGIKNSEYEKLGELAGVDKLDGADGAGMDIMAAVYAKKKGFDAIIYKEEIQDIRQLKLKPEVEKYANELLSRETKVEKLTEQVKDYKTFEDLAKEGDSKQITKFVQKELGEEGFNKLNEQVAKELKDIPVEEQHRYIENRWLAEAQKIVENKQKPNKPSGLGTSTQLGSMIPLNQLGDLAKYGAELTAKGYKSFSKWADEMKKIYGEEISPQLVKIWEMSKTVAKEQKKDEKQIGIKKQADIGMGEGLKEITKTDRQTLYEQNRKVSKENDALLNKTKEKLTKEKEGIKRTAKTVFEPITTSIEKISPEIFRKFRRFSFDYQVKLLGRHKIVGDYFDKQLKAKMPNEVAKDFDLALKNGWIDDAYKIAKKYGFDNELNKVITAKDNLARELGVKTIENHFPRMVDDFEGFVEYLANKYPDYYKDNFSRMIAEKSQRMGRELTKEEQATLINNAVRGYNPGIALSDVSNMRKRMLDILDGEMNQFYANSNVSLMRYMNQMTELAEARKFFGNKGFDVNESIGAYIKDIRDGKKLGIKGSRELMDIFKVRFNQRTITSDPVALLRDIGVITKLGNPFSALTQIKDMAYSVYFSPLGAPKNFGKVVGSKLGLNEIAWKIEEMGIDPLKIAQELSDPRTRSKYVNKSLKWSGFSSLDMIGKETLINTLWDKYQRQARKTGNVNVEFQRRIERYFGKGEEKAKVLDDLRRGKKTDRTAFLLYNELVGAQPISLAEMPRGYLAGGNWRIAYFLKTFSVRQLDFALNETVRVMRNPELPKAQRIEGGKNLFKLATSLVAMGVSVDTLKEWIKSIISGEKFNVEETSGAKAIDNILSVALLSRYDYTTAKREGLGEAVGKKILPPVDFVNDPIIYGLDKLMGEKGEALKMTRNVPILGQFIYEYFKKPKGGINIPNLPSL